MTRPSAALASRSLPEPAITGLTSDSRQVRPGFLFAALPGVKVDGRNFIPAAIQAGATVILAPTGIRLPEGTQGVTLIEDDNPRLRFAQSAAAFYGRQPETVVAVTGTNGKTSTAVYAAQLWTLLGNPAASLGTLGLHGGGFAREGALTTPDPVAIHATLKEAADAGVEHLALEASSHGMDQYRLDGVRIAAGGFTNLSRDHLDYHGTMEAYFESKAMLFSRVIMDGGAAVLNADVPEFGKLREIATKRGLRVLSYGLNGQEIHVRSVDILPHGQRLNLEVLGRQTSVELQLAGQFQAWNALCALGLVIGSGADAAAATDALASLKGVRGRLEHVATMPNGAAIYVDYAHTPDGLETVLKALRSHTANHLHVVFGCGGDRDRGKRPIMGRIACELADRVIVTDDNPRTETPAAIRAEAMSGCTSKAKDIGGRAEAIRTAVADLREGDVLVIAGKGHEQGQTIGTEVMPFDDATVARDAVKEMNR